MSNPLDAAITMIKNFDKPRVFTENSKGKDIIKISGYTPNGFIGIVTIDVADYPRLVELLPELLPSLPIG